MNVKPVINPADYEVGCIIGRFQTNELHDGHINLINSVLERHKKTIILLGVANIQNTERNPLDFASRKMMIQNLYPTVTILPIRDTRFNEKWSQDVDSIITVPYGDKKTVIYGSRDSFIPYYSGKHAVIELEPSVEYSATNIRAEVAKETLDSKDFRSGVIYNAFNQFPVTYPTVDIAVLNDNGEVLLARKPNETLFRFVGGFVDREDETYEVAARRELYEETTLSALSLKYVASQKINDWRYASEKSGIMTTLFVTHTWDGMGIPVASDDLGKGGELKYFLIDRLKDGDYVTKNIVPEHVQLMNTFIGKIVKEQAKTEKA